MLCCELKTIRAHHSTFLQAFSNFFAASQMLHVTNNLLTTRQKIPKLPESVNQTQHDESPKIYLPRQGKITKENYPYIQEKRDIDRCTRSPAGEAGVRRRASEEPPHAGRRTSSALLHTRPSSEFIMSLEEVGKASLKSVEVFRKRCVSEALQKSVCMWKREVL